MKDSARYVKIVEWSEEDQCYVGSCPGLLYAGCHGDDEKQVFAELCQIVEEVIELYKKDGKPLPPPTSGRDYANQMQHVARPRICGDMTQGRAATRDGVRSQLVRAQDRAGGPVFERGRRRQAGTVIYCYENGDSYPGRLWEP